MAAHSADAVVSYASHPVAGPVHEAGESAREETTEEGQRYRTGVRGLMGVALILPVWAGALAIALVLVAVAEMNAVAGKRQSHESAF